MSTGFFILWGILLGFRFVFISKKDIDSVPQCAHMSATPTDGRLSLEPCTHAPLQVELASRSKASNGGAGSSEFQFCCNESVWKDTPCL